MKCRRRGMGWEPIDWAIAVVFVAWVLFLLVLVGLGVAAGVFTTDQVYRALED